jgi:uncharacterized protein YjbI with pentapeptide repeats
MRIVILLICLINSSYPLYGQSQNNLGLNGFVTWLDDTHVRIEYDWSDDSELLDWALTPGSSLTRGDGFVIINGGVGSMVYAMIWKKGIRCSKIIAENVTPLSSSGHLNFYSDLQSFSGNYLPNPGRGAVLSDKLNFWTQDGRNAGSMNSPFLVTGEMRDYVYTLSQSGMSLKSSINDVVYTDDCPCTPELDRMISLGGWAGSTSWGKITIEGEIKIVPDDMINFHSNGSVFSPVIEVDGNPIIEWVFEDGSKSYEPNPVKNYGSAALRYNSLKVTPWTALKGINVGYDASDRGYGNFAMVSNQNISKFQNLSLVKDNLEYLCASYNPLTAIDLNGFTAIEFIELFNCRNLKDLKLSVHPSLRRLCIEDCDIDSLDLSGSPALEDVMASLNDLRYIKWGSIGQSLWHLCIRDNPNLTENFPDLSQFPNLKEFWTWNSNQSGSLVCNSSTIESIQSFNNNFSSAYIQSPNLENLNLSGNGLSTIELINVNDLTGVRLDNCGLNEIQVDLVLRILDSGGQRNGVLSLKGNAVPSFEGSNHVNSLREKGWTIETEISTGIDIPLINTYKLTKSNSEITLLLSEEYSSCRVDIIDISGKIMSTKFVFNNIVTFNTSSYPPGIYFISLLNRKIVIKFLIG